MSSSIENTLTITQENVSLWIKKAYPKHKTWPGKNYWAELSNLKIYYRSEDEYFQFAWKKHLYGHKIIQIQHLNDCVRIVIKFHEGRFRIKLFKMC